MNEFEFNPKDSLLKEQLAESGLEMTITFAGAGALYSIGSSLFGGIMGSSQAKERNAQAEGAYRLQKLQAELNAGVENAQRTAQFKIQQAEYQTNRVYEQAIAERQWGYNSSLKDFEYLNALKQYGKSVENVGEQLTYNDIAALEAAEGEQIKLNEVLDADAFNRQDSMIANLQAAGSAQMGQAGKVRGKVYQSAIAALGRNAAIMDASLSSSVEQSNRTFRQIALAERAANIRAKASMMIQPDRGPDLLKPMQTPERFMPAPVPVAPAAVQRPVMEDTFSPLLEGITGAATTAMSFDWSKFGRIGGNKEDVWAGGKGGAPKPKVDYGTELWKQSGNLLSNTMG